MRRLFSYLAVATSITLNTAHAQVTLDMNRVTCADYLAMPAEQARLFSAWMSGWYNHRLGYITVGLSDFAINIAGLRQWCPGFPRETIMSGLDRSRPQAGPSGQIKVDMSLISCKQYLSSDAERQDTIAYWMSGYIHASRDQPVIDFTRFREQQENRRRSLQEKRQ